MVVQFPIARPAGLLPARSSSVGSHHLHHPLHHQQQHGGQPSAFPTNKQGPPPPPPRDPQRKLPTGPGGQPELPRPMSYAFESGTDYTPHERFRQYFQPAQHGSNLQSLSTVWVGGGGYQRRSGSDNQIAVSYPPPQQQRLQSFTPTPTSRPRPNSVTPDGNGNPGVLRPLPSPQNVGHRMVPRTPPEQCAAASRHIGPQQSHQQVQYFADQYPRSRRPIHVQYNGSSGSYEQPYLSDSQVVMAPTSKQQLPEPRRHPAIVNATDFWRQKEQEAVAGRQRKPASASAKPPLQHSASSSAARSDRSRSNSPHHKDRTTPDKSFKLRVPSASFPSRSTESVSSLSGQSDLASPVQPAKIFSNGPVKDSLESPNGTDGHKKKDASPSNNFRPLSMVLENSENQDRSGSSPGRDAIVQKNQTKLNPPAPPQRRFSRQSSTSSIEASEWMGPEDSQDANLQKKRRSTNLEDALSELEAIYNSLRLGDDDLLDRAERRDAAAARQQHLQRQQRCQQNGEAPVSVSTSWGRGAESDSGYNYGHDSMYGDSEFGGGRQRWRAPGPRKSGVPDIVTDDMAYRRLNPKEQRSSAAASPQDFSSYMLATPALAGVTDLPPAGGRPDTNLDDVVFRNIRHTNNTLRVVEPQPPFGIPLGPVTPAPNSDYLHATPSETAPPTSYRPASKSKKIPDVVKDDLAYRNLRKDSHKDAAGLPSNDVKNEKKKRAIRSLSANLMGLVNRDNLLRVPSAPNDQDFEKAQSLSDLSDPLQAAQKSAEGRNSIGVGGSKMRNVASPVNKQQSDPGSDRWNALAAQQRHHHDHHHHHQHQRYNSASWVERAMLDATSTAAGVSTSTETLTDSRVNLEDAAARRRSWQQRLRVFIPSSGSAEQSVKQSPSPQDISGRRLSFGKPPPYTPPPPATEGKHHDRAPVDENNLEDLLSALAHEARATSEKLDRELKQLGDSTTNLKLTAPPPLQSPKAVANLTVKERQSTPVRSSSSQKSPSSGLDEKEDERNRVGSTPADHSLLHNILSQHEAEERPRSGEGSGLRGGEYATKTTTVELRLPPEENCEIRNLSCDGSVLISEIVRQGRRRRRRSGEDDDGGDDDEDSGRDQLVPDVAGAGASDEEADLEVARATAAAEAGTAAGPWRLGEFLGPAVSPHIAAGHPKTLTSSKMTQRPSPEAAAASAAPAPDASSAERVSRYKEERRRQLASQLGAAPTAGPGPPPQRRFISRAASAASASASATAASASASSGDAQAAAAAPRVRTTRASRLRSAAAASSDSSPNADAPLDGSCGNGAAAAALAGAAARTRRLGAAGAAGSTLPSRRSSAANGTAAERQTQSAQSDSGPRREKDKSSKRKSNLNRCLTAEAVAPAVHSDESSGGGSVRRRRRPVNGAGPAPATAPTASSAPGAAPDHSTPVSRSRKSFDGSLDLGRSAVHADAITHSASPVGGSPRQHQQHSRLNGTTSTVGPISPVRSTASPCYTPRTSSPRTSATGFVPVVNTRKPSSPLVTPSKSRLTESRYLSKKSDIKSGDTPQKVDILTALTKESLARLDRLTNTSVSEEATPRGTGESHIIRSSTSSTLSNGHGQDHGEHSLKKSASAVVSVDTPSSFTCEDDPELTIEIHERSKSPTKPASSILKKKSLEEPIGTVPSVPVVTAQPVSILKRKTSQDEAGSSASTTPAPPVTFSPSVEDHVRNSRRQGILKKRASLDESEVMRRRSCSPDVNHSWARDSYEFRPILKNQRRSSMEELVRRTQSPELQPHSILKRKTSRDDDTEERTLTSPEPQGILKRKSNVSSSSSSGSGSPHVSISQTVIMNVAGISSTEFGADASEIVRPILKKKSSSEDTTTADSSSADTPKPILKKKTSMDVDDSEDRPKKPILKSSRRSSQEGRGSVSLDGTPRESPTRCLKLHSHSATASDSTSGSDGEAVRPILKQTNSRERSSSPRPRLSFCDDEDEDRLIGRSTASSGSDTTRPASPVGEVAALRRNRVLCSPISPESERGNIAPKRSSWEPRSSVDVTDNVQLQNEPNSDEPRSLSVAERIVNMESLLSQPVESSSAAAVKTGAVPKRQGLARSLRDKERFHTQPVTMDELEASALLASAHDFHRSLTGRGPPSRPNEPIQINGDKVSSSTDESPSADTSVPDSLDDTLASTPSPATESDKHLQHTRSPSPAMEGRQNSGAAEETDEKVDSEGASLTKSCSVSAMASLFARKQEDSTRAGSTGVNRYRERRRLWAGESRVATQPVTQVEVEEAVRLNSQQSMQSDVPVESSSAADDGNEDDPSKLSLSERIRLFNQKIKDEQTVKQPELGPRVTVKRTARFKTQPVTNEEVEIAQKKISNLAASLAKPPDPDTLGGLSIRAAREKIYEHAANILTKSSSASRLGQQSTSSRDASPTRLQLGYADSETKPRGILKHSDSQKAEAVSSEEATEQESETEVKGILKSSSISGRVVKTPEPDSSRHLKSVLKKDTSIEERPSLSSTENLSLIGDYPKSILKPKAKEWVDESSSTSSEDSGAASDSDSERAAVTSSKRGIDLISILHDAEARARQQRQQASRPNTGEKIKNIKNLKQEKENQVFTSEQISDSQKKENSQRTIEQQQYSSQKLVSSTSVVEENSRSNANAMKQINITNHRNNVNRKQITTEVNRLHKHLNSEHRLSLDANTSQTSDGETSSSGGREVKRIIRNEAVARRRQIAITRQNRSGASSQPAGEQLPPAGPALAKSRSQPCVQQPATPPSTPAPAYASAAHTPTGLQRSRTQPMAADLHHLSGASIADRLAALQKSGDTQWRKRISHLNPEDEITIIATKNQINELQAHHHDPDGDAGSAAASPGSILADRLGKLDAATQGWRKRVGPTDAERFSVAGRMRMRGGAGDATHHLPLQPSLPPQLQGGSPSEKATRRVPRALRFRSKAAQVKNASSTPTSPQKESPVNISFKRSLSAPGGDEENGLSSAGREDEPTGPTVAVPRADDETFLQFFHSLSTEKLQSDRLEIRDEDLDEIIAHSSQLLVQKKSVKVQRRNITSRNPLKVLAARTDLQEEYVEVKTGIAEKEIRRLNVEKLAKSSPLAVEALAGLASKEDFTAVALKKASSSVGSLLPYKDLMLIHVKGRRHVQSRIVEPTVESINHGDNYVLVTPTEVFNWVGLYSNVIERSRGAEIAQYIVQKKDLGYTGSGQVITISEEKITCSTSQKKRFWQLLGAEENNEGGTPAYAGHPDEDELYENCILATNKVYELQDHELVPMEEYWGSIPRIQMLDPSKIIVFDFGSEMYIWNGKNASLDNRREAVHLARELWSEGYDYTGCDVCPLTISAALGSHSQHNMTTPVTGSERPSWALLGKVTQHMETILFREKFLDWPDFSRVIRSKVMDDIDKQVDATIDIKPCDTKQMTESKPNEPDLELEGLHLGRGSNYFDQEMRRHYEITTLGVTVWHIQEYEHSELPELSVGQFHMGDSYVIRWQYSITVTGRELSGQPSRHSVAGRDRCAYFCWQGQDASLNEQGAAALLTVELDHERGPQVRVVQGYEPPAFLALFQGGMVTHTGRRGETDIQDPWRLFVCRGELPQEAVLVEVTCSIRQLRNRGCFVLLNTSTGAIHVWYGKKSPTHARKVAKSAVERIQDKRPPEIGFKASANLVIYEQQEGAEKKEFFQGLGGSSRQLYTSVQANGTPRLFHLSSISGSFSATEVLSPYRHPDFSVAFPFLQEDLYSASQPALFLLDSGSELWLWQGWWPDTTEDPSTQTGSGAVRWQAERRAAMQTALDYAHHMGRRKSSAWLVWAGLEPLEFTNLFPVWTDRDDIAELNIRDGRKPGEVLTVEDELARLTCSTYPPAQLLQRPLPDGVDPTCLEIYLDPNHFQELLGMSKEEFSSLPLWKQTKLKKDVGLF